MLHPSDSPFPTMAGNSPVFSPFTQPDGFVPTPFSEVSETTAIGSAVTGDIVTPQGPENSLMALRHQFPYLPILPFTNSVKTIALPQGAPVEMHLPSSAVVALFQGSGNYYVCSQGNAAIPVVGQDGTSSIFKPENYMFYIRGLRSLSFISPDAACTVTAMFFMPREFPM